MIRTADTRFVRSDTGFTLIELVVVLAIMAILAALAVGFQAGAREGAADATARANRRTAIPAIEEGITVVSTSSAGYCVAASVEGSTWFKAGPDGQITQTACS